MNLQDALQERQVPDGAHEVVKHADAAIERTAVVLEELHRLGDGAVAGKHLDEAEGGRDVGQQQWLRSGRPLALIHL